TRLSGIASGGAEARSELGDFFEIPGESRAFFGLDCSARQCLTLWYTTWNAPSGVKGHSRRMLMKRKLFLRWVAIVAGLLLAGRANAQSTTATILGAVTDKSGAAVAGASVTARNTQTNLARGATSNEQGEYRIEFLPVGTYELEVTGKGFKKAV